MLRRYVSAILTFWLMPLHGIHAETSAAPRLYVKSVYSLPLTLDPIQMNDTASLVAGNLIYDGLVRFSPTLKIEPSIAESWSTSENGKVLTFILRSQARFHDGSLITAQDAANSLFRAVSNSSKVRKLYDCIVGVEGDGLKKGKIGIQAKDARTFVITLKHPYPPILSILAGATAKVLPAKSVEAKDFFNAPIGSGPFKFVSRDEKNKEVRLAGFPDYFGGTPKLTGMILKETSEAEAVSFAQKGDIDDLSNWPLTEKNPVFSSGQKISSPVAATWIIGLNVKKPPFRDQNLRRSFRAAFDSNKFRAKFYPDALRAYGYVPVGLPGYRSSPKGKDPRKAVVAKQKIQIAVPIVLENANEMKSYIEAEYRKQGWNVEVVLTEWNQLMKGYSEKALQSFLVAMNMDYPDADFLLKNFESDNSDNFSGLSNSTLDRLLKQSRTFRDRQEREKVYRKALEILDDSAVTLNLFHPRANAWLSNCVQGFEANILSDVYVNYAKIDFKPGCEQNRATP